MGYVEVVVLIIVIVISALFTASGFVRTEYRLKEIKKSMGEVERRLEIARCKYRDAPEQVATLSARRD